MKNEEKKRDMPTITHLGLAIWTTLTLVLLRVGGVIEWRWVCVFAPLIAFAVLAFASFFVALIIAVITYLHIRNKRGS